VIWVLIRERVINGFDLYQVRKRVLMKEVERWEQINDKYNKKGTEVKVTSYRIMRSGVELKPSC